MVAIFLVACLFWAFFWSGISAAIWRAKGGDAGLAAVVGFFLGIFAAVYFALATPSQLPEQAPGQRYEPQPDLLPRWRDRRLGPVGWSAAAVGVMVIALLLVTAPGPR